MISREFEARVFKTNGQRVRIPITVELVYDPDSDPLAVQMILSVPDEEDVVWSFSRDLMDEGSRSGSPVGVGDIKFRRTIGHWFLVCLNNSNGHADLGLPVDEVLAFLKETQAAADEADEFFGAQLDSLIADILNG